MPLCRKAAIAHGLLAGPNLRLDPVQGRNIPPRLRDQPVRARACALVSAGVPISPALTGAQRLLYMPRFHPRGLRGAATRPAEEPSPAVGVGSPDDGRPTGLLCGERDGRCGPPVTSPCRHWCGCSVHLLRGRVTQRRVRRSLLIPPLLSLLRQDGQQDSLDRPPAHPHAVSRLAVLLVPPLGRVRLWHGSEPPMLRDRRPSPRSPDGARLRTHRPRPRSSGRP